MRSRKGIMTIIEWHKHINTYTDWNRISKDMYYINIALATSLRSTCLRRKYGAVIVCRDSIISTGYNGAPRGTPNCCDLGKCTRDKDAVMGSNYDKCVSAHAEWNAIICPSRQDMMGGTIYLAGLEKDELVDAWPCTLCRRLLINAGISYLCVVNMLGNIQKFRLVIDDDGSGWLLMKGDE